MHRDGRRILCDVQWRLAEGERWVLVGGNGAGKTQLLKLISGAVWPDPDTLTQRRYLWSGRSRALPEITHRLSYVGPERQDRHERHDWNFSVLEVVGTGLTQSDIPQGPLSSKQRKIALQYLTAVGLQRLCARRFLELSFGERRLVLLARAMACGARWLLLDELFAGLDARHRGRMLRALSRYPGSWVLSTHRREEIPRTATHIAEIRAGRLERTEPIRPADRQKSERRWVKPGRDANATRRRRATSSVVRLTNADVYLEYRAVLKDISFTVNAGECWMVHGPNGSGKSTLLRTIYGDHPVALDGRIDRRGISRGVPLSEFRAWCAIVAPHLQANPPPGESVLETVVSGLRSSIGLDEPPTPQERRRARVVLCRLGLLDFLDLPLRTLSYGQVRRVLFARALVLRPRLLLLDEALAGIDEETRGSLREQIERFVAAGGSVVFASHHPDEWPRNATHELELRRGRPTFAGPLRGSSLTTGSVRVTGTGIGRHRPARG